MYVGCLLFIETLPISFHLGWGEGKKKKRKEEEEEKPSKDQFLKQYWNCINEFIPSFPLLM